MLILNLLKIKMQKNLGSYLNKNPYSLNNLENEELQISTEFELGRKSVSGSISHIALFLVVLFFTPLRTDRGVLISILGVFLVLANSLRFFLSIYQMHYYPKYRTRWLITFDILLIVTAGVWGVLCGEVLRYYGVSSTVSTTLFLIVSGVTAAAATSLNTDMLRAYVFIGLVIGIPSAYMFFIPNAEIYFVLVFFIYFVFLSQQIRNQYLTYCNLFKSKQKIDRQSQAIEAAMQTQTMLLNHSKKVQTLLEAAEKIGLHGSWELDILTMTSKWSQGLYLIFNLDSSRDAPSFENFMLYVFPTNQLIIRSLLEDIIAGKQREFSINFQVKLNNGFNRTFCWSGVVVTNSESLPIKIMGTVSDITELMLVQNEAEFYKKALNQAAIVVITDHEGVITYANDNFCLISGYTNNELVGKPHSIVKSGLMGASFYKDMWMEISSGKVWRREVCNRRKNGQFYWVDCTIIPFLNEMGEIDRYVSICTDIGKRKQTEEELMNLNSAYQDAYKKLELAEQIGKFGSWEFDIRKENFSGSCGLRKLLRLTDNEDLSYQTFMGLIDAGDREIIAQAIEETTVSLISFKYDFKANLSGGNTCWLGSEWRPVCGSSRKIEKIVGIAHDVTEKVESEFVLAKAKRQAEVANRAKAQFLANMSHELRTPMNGVIGMTSLLLASVEEPQQIEKLKIIQNCGNSLLELINDILDFSKIEANKLELENESFALHASVQEIIQLLSAKASEKGLVITYQSLPDVPGWVLGDVTRFRQVIMNLISNAIKFTQKGSVSISSSVNFLVNDLCEIQFLVKDTGVGVPDSIKERLFQPFSQADAATTRKFGGTGLGLSICKGICEKMGGTIWLENNIDGGATFGFTFKAGQAKALAIKTSNPFADVDPKMGQKNPLKILIAEDNSVNQMVVVGLLGKLGYQADVVENGLEALKILSVKSYDIIFMDCHMPIMDGFETSQKINELFSEELRPKIVALTASIMKEDIDRCYESGMRAFIGKPITINSLIEVLNKSKKTNTVA